jgi:glycosyltransferase involved in cell wall biosynthesis
VLGRAPNGAMDTPPSVLISLDFELRWGVHDQLGFNRDASRKRLENVRLVVPTLLTLLSTRSVRATWAAVGAIGCRDWTEYLARAPQPPKYQNPSLAVSPRYADLDPNGELHFAPELLHAVCATPGQDLGTHTFSHIPMREPGITADDVRADLQTVSALWRERFGAPPISLVFPRNQVAFLSVVRSCGIRMWRGNERPWYYDRNEDSTNRLFPRALRLLEAINPLVRRSAATQGDMTRASLFLRTYLPAAAWALHCARIRHELDALRPPRVLHIWWHPDDLGANTPTRLARVEQVLDMIAERRLRGRLVSGSMRDLVEEPRHDPRRATAATEDSLPQRRAVRVLLLSRYGRLGASSRVRSYQYIPYLRERNVEVTPAPLLGDRYIKRLYEGRSQNVAAIFAAYCRRLWNVASCSRFDLLWVEYELLPWLPAWVEATQMRPDVPYVVDYDDAVFHRYELHRNPLVRGLLGRKIDEVMRRARLVIVGNEYLGARAWRAGAARVEHLPTVVDLSRYSVSSAPPGSGYNIGWIGSPLTAPYLNLVKPALVEVCGNGGGRVTLIGSGPVSLDSLPTDLRPWSESTEVAELQRFDVGIMPLPDEPWERGKCGYKLIQYMACGRPVVASPVGMSTQIVEHGVNGFLASTQSEWIAALRALRDVRLRAQMGAAGRAKVERGYCVQVTAPRLSSLLSSVVRSE